MSDGGLYVCVASNIAGNLTQSIELSVLGKLEEVKHPDKSKKPFVRYECTVRIPDF